MRFHACGGLSVAASSAWCHGRWSHDQPLKWSPTVLTSGHGDRGRGVWVDSRRDGAPDAASMR
jgi:hypothetical protein